MKDGEVIALQVSPSHSFSKSAIEQIELIENQGVKGDAHCGVTVKHRSRVKRDPSQPNLRQVHLIHSELFMELEEKGFTLLPGDLGENITTKDIPLLELPEKTRLHLGDRVILELTGLRNPCNQIEDFMPGLLKEVCPIDEHGNMVRKCGVMAVVVCGGVVAGGDHIRIELPEEPFLPLQRV